jgi:hypothetical protein
MKVTAVLAATAAVASAGIADNYFVNSPQFRVGNYIQDAYKNALTSVTGLRNTLLAQPRGADVSWMRPYFQRLDIITTPGTAEIKGPPFNVPAVAAVTERDIYQYFLAAANGNSGSYQNTVAQAIGLGRVSGQNPYIHWNYVLNPMARRY